MRLRELLILCMTETAVLSETYNNQKEIVNRNNNYLHFSNALSMETNQIPMDQYNYVDEGSMTDVHMELAINEFDPTIRSNLNFIHTESVQCLMLDSGVSDLRAVLHY